MNTLSGRPDAELETMRDVVVHRLQNLYEVTREILQAMPDIAEAVGAPQLKQAITAYLERTHGQLSRLEQAFELIGESPQAALLHTVDRLREGRDQRVKQARRDPLTEADVIDAARQVEHYEFVTLRPVPSHVKQWGQPRLTELLEEILEEERETDKSLTEIMEAVVREK